MIPGGFGAAKNLNQWAISGKDGPILPEVRDVIRKFLELQKPVAALCMGPTVVAKALEGTSLHPTLTVGSSSAPSPYDIQGIARGMESIGARVEMKTINQISVDLQNKIITAPCYMMEANISQVRDNVDQVVEELKRLI